MCEVKNIWIFFFSFNVSTTSPMRLCLLRMSDCESLVFSDVYVTNKNK